MDSEIILLVLGTLGLIVMIFGLFVALSILKEIKYILDKRADVRAFTPPSLEGLDEEEMGVDNFSEEEQVEMAKKTLDSFKGVVEKDWLDN